MTKNWIAINILLLMVAGFLGWQLRRSIYQFKAANDLGKIQPVMDMKQKMNAEGGLAPIRPPRVYNAAEFSVIPEKNVFSEFRAREEKTDTPAVAEVPPLAQKPVLVGVTISGGMRMASIIDPLNTSQARRAQTKRLGDVYQGYTITDITEDRIVLESGSRREIIPLHDGAKHQPQAGKTPILATRVVSFGAGGSAGGGAVAVISGGPGRTPAPVAVPTPITPVVQPVTPRPAAQPARQTAAPLQPATPIYNPAAAPAGNVIRTPFGDIVRDPTPKP